MKNILLGVLIGLFAFPAVTLGGTFVSSLIQGKSVREAVKILAQQLDALVGRVGALEQNMEIQKWCNEMNFLATKFDRYAQFGETIEERLEFLKNSPKYSEDEPTSQREEARYIEMNGVYQEYLAAKAKCES